MKEKDKNKRKRSTCYGISGQQPRLDTAPTVTLSLSRTSVHRKLRPNTNLQHKPYLVQVKVALSEAEITSRQTMCNWFSDKTLNDTPGWIIWNMWLTDVAHFNLDRAVNRKS